MDHVWVKNSRNVLCLGKAKVWTASFWRLHFGSGSPKRTRVWSNSWEIRRLDLGPVSKAMIAACEIKTVKKYVDGSGKSRFSGSSSLKGTQY